MSDMTYTMWREWEESNKDAKEFDLMIEDGGIGEEKFFFFIIKGNLYLK